MMPHHKQMNFLTLTNNNPRQTNNHLRQTNNLEL